MTETAQITVSAVEASLNYLAPMRERPVTYTFEPPPGIPWRSGAVEVRALRVEDARPRIGSLSLDREGFSLVRHRTAVTDFYDAAAINAVYYPEAEELLRNATGASRVLVFDHNIRSAVRARSGENDIREPVKRVHNDFTDGSGPVRARAELRRAGLGESVIDALLRLRFAIINLWRPIRGPVEESPLALCDASSMKPEDFVASDLVYRDRVGETYQVISRPTHRWSYFPALRGDEVLLIKCYDAATDGRARFTAHTAFDDPSSPSRAAPRESIELRALAFFGGAVTSDEARR